MTIRLFLANNQFVIAPGNKCQDFPTFVKYYDAINLMAVFNHLTGEFYGVRFASAEEIAEYQGGGGVDYLYFFPARVPVQPVRNGRGLTVEKILVLPVINLHTIETTKNLQIALAAFERIIDAELNGIKYHVSFGARVIVSDENGKRIGCVTGLMANSIVVNMENGLPLSCKPSVVERLDLPYFVPGEWIESVEQKKCT